MKVLRGAAVAAVVAALALSTGCGSSSGDSSTGGGGGGGDVVIGASLPITGSLAVFGPLMQKGYERAVADVNQAGGIEIDGEKRQVKLLIRDNKSDPTVATDQFRTLAQQDQVALMLGATTPPLTIPLSATADALHVPLVSGLTPIRAWLAGNKQGWQWAWDFFIDEAVFTNRQFEVADMVDTNKKVALFTDNEQDGQVMGTLWEQNAPKHGYDVVYHAKFPVGTTDYSSFIAKAKASGAQIVITQMVPPDGVALWKQMKSLNYVPKVAFCEKCGNNGGWGKALGQTAVGTSTLGYWSKSLGLPKTDELVSAFEQDTGNNEDLSTIVVAYSVAEIGMDAIGHAGSTDRTKINAALAKIDADYPAGHIKFAPDHSAVGLTLHKQWVSPTEEKVVYPKKDAEQALQAPVAGLAG